MKVGVLGWGALGSAIGSRLATGSVAGAQLSAVTTRSAPTRLPPAPVVDVAELGASCDLVIETAGQAALSAHAAELLDSGTRLLVLSTGALRDQTLFERLRDAGHARLLFGTGAIGGLDIIGACRHIGAIRSVTLRTTKPPRVLAQPWMDQSMIEALEAGTEIVECFRGPALQAAERFPASVNVAATLAIAAGEWDLVDVEVIADPSATGNRHHITIEADAGTYAIDVANAALADNPASSALVVGSTLRAVETLVNSSPHLV